MDVHVGELRSTVHATDSSAPLSPRAVEQLVAAVLERLQVEGERDRRFSDELRLRPGVPAAEDEDARG
jgi:hypothetical protein